MPSSAWHSITSQKTWIFRVCKYWSGGTRVNLQKALHYTVFILHFYITVDGTHITDALRSNTPNKKPYLNESPPLGSYNSAGSHQHPKHFLSSNVGWGSLQTPPCGLLTAPGINAVLCHPATLGCLHPSHALNLHISAWTVKIILTLAGPLLCYGL
jgi:hypothetical protein